jgi:hypothetical protein
MPASPEHSVEACARRGAKEGEQYEAAILQRLREQIWAALNETDDPERILKLLPVFIRVCKATGDSGEAGTEHTNDILRKFLLPSGELNKNADAPDGARPV